MVWYGIVRYCIVLDGIVLLCFTTYGNKLFVLSIKIKTIIISITTTIINNYNYNNNNNNNLITDVIVNAFNNR